MYTFYLTQNGSLERERNTLVFIGKDFKRYIPVKNVSEIIITSKVSLSSWALDYLGKIGIIVHLLDEDGYYRSTLIPMNRNELGSLTVKQAIAYSDDRRAIIASEMVEGIRYNIIRNLRYYNKEDKLRDSIERIKGYSISKDNINSILGTEGNIWSEYYATFKYIYKGHESFQRKFRPPTDDLNAMISFGNSLLYGSVLTNLIISGLNPSISFLHEPSERSFSLALDVADIFKPVIVERLVSQLVNTNVINQDDFESRGEGIYLNERGRQKFVSAYRDRMEATVKYGSRYLSYSGLILEECYKLRRAIEENEKYKSFRMWD
ncbi:MAG: type I-B CRISPR-associated endonuclease Cas1b [Candidatus Micrarchaeaceae archaeon]